MSSYFFLPLYMCNHISDSALKPGDYVSILAAIIAFIAVGIGFITLRFSIYSNIQNLLSEKAKDCNKYILIDKHNLIETEGNISAVVTNIVFAKELLKVNYRSYLLVLWGLGRQALKDQFYLQLHTSIIVFIKNKKLPGIVTDPSQKAKMNQQLKDSFEFLKKSCEKFEKL